MARIDRIAVLFVVIVVYSFTMNIFLVNYLDKDGSSSSSPGADLKKKLNEFIRRHRHNTFMPVGSGPGKGAKTDDLDVDQSQQEEESVGKKDGSKEETANDDKDDHDEENSRERIVKILEASGMKMNHEIIASLPTWGEVKALYGDKPKIVGLEQCSKFRLEIPEVDAYVSPAGLFNTGTNLLAELLQKNCKLPKRKWDRRKHKDVKFPNRMISGMLYQVPWGKHNPLFYRNQHKALMAPTVEVVQDHVLPVVMIKDPFYWMGSICRHKYATNWWHTKKHCPNLVPNENDIGHRGITINTESVPVRVRYQDSNDKVIQYKSMIDFWNTWYSDYLDETEFPRIFVRFEDILFHMEDVVTEICHCGGGELTTKRDEMHLSRGAAKSGLSHTGSNGLLQAIVKYGSAKHRLDGMTAEDVKFANENARTELMELFAYSYPTVPDE